jgi:hypothetical protein
VGSFNGTSTKYSQSTGATSYNVDGQPVPHADATPVCGQTDAESSTINVAPGSSLAVGTLSFTGCS